MSRRRHRREVNNEIIINNLIINIGSDQQRELEKNEAVPTIRKQSDERIQAKRIRTRRKRNQIDYNKLTFIIAICILTIIVLDKSGVMDVLLEKWNQLEPILAIGTVISSLLLNVLLKSK